MEGYIENEQLVLKADTDIHSSTVRDLVQKSKKYMAEGNYEAVVFDISNVKIIDSMGISFIVGLFKSSSQMNKKFTVTGVNQEILKLFNLMRLDSVFDIVPL